MAERALAFAVGALLAYAGLRAGSVIAGEPDPRSVGPTAHVAYFWRVALATWAGGVAAAAQARFGWPSPGGRALAVALAIAVTVGLLAP
ncbi:MAG: hypothetical protein FJ090_22035 [Deltaproteobacteria bacterium]|nr:hypothetical protein [Deltaproteobacteria bacterium]